MEMSTQVPHPCQPMPRTPHTKPQTVTHAQKLRKLYNVPAPFHIFPLPIFLPHNPLSLIHIIFTWLSQLINPKDSQIFPAYQGFLSLETRSVHVTEVRSIRGLWEQGFYGKGNLSRSEPNWLDGERARRENKVALTSEEFTRKRRLERQKLKWERARKERLTIDQILLEEAEELNQNGIMNSSVTSCVDPIELLTFPNSQLDPMNQNDAKSNGTNVHDNPTLTELAHNVSSSCISMLDSPQSSRRIDEIIIDTPIEKPSNFSPEISVEKSNFDTIYESSIEYHDVKNYRESKHGSLNSFETFLGYKSFSKISSIYRKLIETSVRLCKSVYFFSNVINENPILKNSHSSIEIESKLNEDRCLIIRNEEHLQLTFEEAFFLSYALGCLNIIETATMTRISNQTLFKHFRQYSSFPSKIEKMQSPDDKFMINYVVYHHFRSLGWVVRSGIKFSVDYLLYNRGPVFSHAEFSVLILPAYSHSYWTSTMSLAEYSRQKQHRTWAWLSCINRVISQVKKTLVLCYVDIPPPLSIEDEERMSLDVKLSRYKIREFILNRFLTNRMRA
ncbi:putative tRNA-splicing endonuclease subunit tsp-2 [Erysiphe necator]|nr:putative tRNA-splicing endonuclease subunit tsp-2 [Erysiphe necator]